MMNAIFKVAEGVPCRACGAVLAAKSDNEYGLCLTCWRSVQSAAGVHFDMRRNTQKVPRDMGMEVASWLARKLMRDMRRTHDGYMVGRCEAISNWIEGQPGSQCAKSATEWREGHKVCARHARATSPVYVGSDKSDHYAVFTHLIASLCRKDEAFRRAVELALEREPA